MSPAGFWRWLPLGATWVCWGLFGLVWLGGAIYNLRRAPATRERCALPGSWLIGIVAYVILYRLTPAQVWTPITVETRWLVILGIAVAGSRCWCPDRTEVADGIQSALRRVSASGGQDRSHDYGSDHRWRDRRRRVGVGPAQGRHRRHRP